MTQSDVTEPRVVLLAVVPLMSQISTTPVVVLRQRMSALPSPSKSPVPWMTQSEVRVPGLPLPVKVAPLMSHS